LRQELGRRCSAVVRAVERPYHAAVMRGERIPMLNRAAILSDAVSSIRPVRPGLGRDSRH
jgi:hypothetical protein